jgi:ABC-type uncharacterized transport system ATPase subunit
MIVKITRVFLERDYTVALFEQVLTFLIEILHCLPVLVSILSDISFGPKMHCQILYVLFHL